MLHWRGWKFYYFKSFDEWQIFVMLFTHLLCSPWYGAQLGLRRNMSLFRHLESATSFHMFCCNPPIPYGNHSNFCPMCQPFANWYVGHIWRWPAPHTWCPACLFTKFKLVLLWTLSSVWTKIIHQSQIYFSNVCFKYCPMMSAMSTYLIVGHTFTSVMFYHVMSCHVL